MISRRTRIQLVVFVVLATLGVVYVGGAYAGLGRLFGPTTYTVSMELADSGGIFTNAEVTYRGVTVGRVGELHPTTDGVEVDLEIERGTDTIPADGVRAEVRNLSLIGEPYVDLTPTSTSGPYLEDGSVIPVASTSTPVAPAVLLSSLDGLLKSVPQKKVTTVLRELDTAFADNGDELGDILDNTSDLVKTADEVLPETLALIDDGSTVLGTQNRDGSSIRSFSSDLRLLAGQLKSSDTDLRRLLRTAPDAARSVTALLDESGPAIGSLVADLVTSGRLTGPRIAALRQILVTYPVLARAAYSAVPGDGTVHFGLVLNAFDPLPCTQGYESTKKRPGTATKDVPVNRKATCTEPAGSPVAVRGSQRAPHQGVPQAAPAPRSTSASSGGASTSASTGALSQAEQALIAAGVLTALQDLPPLVMDPIGAFLDGQAKAQR